MESEAGSPYARVTGAAATLIAVLALCFAGCGSGADDGPAVGPVTAKAAVDALECDGERPFFRAKGSYGSGLESVQSSPAEAFDDYVEESGIGYRAPVEGYRVEQEDADRALLSYDVRDRSRVAVVLRDGIRDWNGGVGWGVVAWAMCDPAELPADVTDELNVGVWQDDSGRRVPVTRVRSFQGPEHCSWTDITFLLIGPSERRADWYARDVSGELSELLRGRFAADATLPDGATFTGWTRGGRELWLGPGKQAAFLVDSDDPGAVERWPAAKEPILCA